MHPYRAPPDDPVRGESDSESGSLDEWLVAGALIVLGGLRVTVAIADGESFGTEVTITAMLLVLGLILAARLGLRTRVRP